MTAGRMLIAKQDPSRLSRGDGSHLPHNMDCLFFRERGNDLWSSVSRSAKPGADILISNLSPATWYQIKVKSDFETNYSLEVQVTAEERRSQSDSDHTSLEFEIATLAADGSGFSGDKSPLLLFQVVSSRSM